jgi:hypothetical protein
MNFAAKIVVRKTAAGNYVAGFASQTGKGQIVATFGCWYGSQMSYGPFRRAMAAARDAAQRLSEREMALDESASEQERQEVAHV